MDIDEDWLLIRRWELIRIIFPMGIQCFVVFSKPHTKKKIHIYPVKFANIKISDFPGPSAQSRNFKRFISKAQNEL